MSPPLILYISGHLETFQIYSNPIELTMIFSYHCVFLALKWAPPLIKSLLLIFSSDSEKVSADGVGWLRTQQQSKRAQK